MLRRLFCLFIVLLALVLAILAVSMPKQVGQSVMMFTTFVEVMIPFLAVGALINYIWKSNEGSCCCSSKKDKE